MLWALRWTCLWVDQWACLRVEEACHYSLDRYCQFPYERRSLHGIALRFVAVSCSSCETRPKRVCGVQIDASRASQCTTTSMVSSFLVEALSSPTDVLLSFYDTYDHEAINEFPKAVVKHFSDIFRTEEAFLEVHSPGGPHPSRSPG